MDKAIPGDSTSEERDSLSHHLPNEGAPSTTTTHAHLATVAPPLPPRRDGSTTDNDKHPQQHLQSTSREGERLSSTSSYLGSSAPPGLQKDSTKRLDDSAQQSSNLSDHIHHVHHEDAPHHGPGGHHHSHSGLHDHYNPAIHGGSESFAGGTTASASHSRDLGSNTGTGGHVVNNDTKEAIKA